MGGLLGDLLPPGWDLDGAAKAAADFAASTDPTNPAFWGKVGNAVTDITKAASATVENFLKDPLPVIATVGLTALGVPPAASQFIVGMAQGRSPEEAAKGAVVSYVSGLAGQGVAGATAGAIGDAGSVAVNNILASGATGSVAALLSGKNMQDALAAGAEAALTGQVTNAIKAAGVDPSAIGGKAILDSARAAMGAIYRGDNIANAVGKAAASSAIATSIKNLTGLAVSQKAVLQTAAANAKAAKAKAAALVANSKYLKDPVASKAAIERAEAANKASVDAAKTTIANKQNEVVGLSAQIKAAKEEEARLGGPANVAAAAAALLKSNPAAYAAKYGKFPGGKYMSSADLQNYSNSVQNQITAAQKTVTDAAAPRAEFEAEAKAYQVELEAVNKAAGDIKLANDTLAATSEQIAKQVTSFQAEALKGIQATPEATKILADAKTLVSQQAATDLAAAKAAGFTNYADMKAAQGVAAPDYYAQKLGFLSAKDQVDAKAKGYTTASAWAPQRAAIAAGFQNAADYAAAKGTPAPDYYAVKSGFANAADQTAAKAAGFTTSASWKAQQAAEAAGFKNAADKAAAGTKTAPDFYATKAGFANAADQKAAIDKGVTDPKLWAANKLGFATAADQAAAAGKSAGDYYAIKAGFLNAADQAKANAAQITDSALWKAKQAGFDSVADQTKAATYKENAATYKANQPARDLGWANAAELKAANGMEKNAFMAQKLGFANADDYKAAVAQKLDANKDLFYAQKAGFQSVLDANTAKAANLSAAQFYLAKQAKDLGYKTVDDLTAAFKSGAKTATEFYNQQTAAAANFQNIDDYNAAKTAGQTADVFYAEKNAKAAGFANAAEKIAADALKLNAADYKKHQAAVALGFSNYQQLLDAQASYKASQAGFKSVADQTAAAGKSAADFYDERGAEAGGYKNVADYRAAKGMAAPDFYAKQAGFKSPGDQSLASLKNQTAADFYADQTAQSLGYKDAAEQNAAKGIPPADYRAKQLGYADYADQQKAGTMPAADWNNLKSAQAAGFGNYEDMQKALGVGANAKDFYSQQKGFANYAEEVAANGKSAEEFHADLQANSQGFANAADQAAAQGKTAPDFYAAQKGFANAADARSAGTMSATDYYNNQKATAAGYKNATDWLAGKGLPGGDYYAQQAGFPDAQTQAKASAFGFGDMQQYQAYLDRINTPPAPPPVVSPPPVAPPVAPPAVTPPVVSPPPAAPPPVAPPVVPVAPPAVSPPPVSPIVTPPVVMPPAVTPPVVTPPAVVPPPVVPPVVPPPVVAPPVAPPVTPPVIPPVTPPAVVPPVRPPTPVVPTPPVTPVRPAVPSVFGQTPNANVAATLANILARRATPAVPGTPTTQPQGVTLNMTPAQRSAYNQSAKAAIDKLLGIAPTSP